MILYNNGPLVDTATESQTSNAYQTNILTGTGPYANPNDIYLPGHRTYLDIPFGENTRPDISGIIKNIDVLKEGSTLKILQPEDAIRVFDPFLTENYILDKEYNGISVNLNFGGYNVITDPGNPGNPNSNPPIPKTKANIFKNL